MSNFFPLSEIPHRVCGNDVAVDPDAMCPPTTLPQGTISAEVKRQTDSLEKLAIRLMDEAVHANYGTALLLVALAALSVAALSLWTLTVVVRAVTSRKK